MHQFVQSAIEAAKQGDNDKALDFLKQVLNANPNDVEAWLVLAAVVDDPLRKRHCLRRVLALDPVNQVAREELMEMDRAEMEATLPSSPEADPLSTGMYQPDGLSFHSAGMSALGPNTSVQDESPKTQPQTPIPAKKEKRLVFKYPIVWRILMYFFAVIFGCVGLLMFTQSMLTGLLFLGFAALALVAVLGFFPTVELSRQGIRTSGLFSSAETSWDEIVKMKSNAMKRRMELAKRNGEVVNVSTQVSGYPRIVEILQKRRPDLFGGTPKSRPQAEAFPAAYDREPPSKYDSPSPAPAFKGARIFKKSVLKQYGSYLIVIPLFLFAVRTVFTEPQYRVGAGLAVFFCLVMLVLPLFQVSVVKVEPNKLTVETFFEEKVFSAKEIRAIKMDTVRGRYGRATNFVNILPVKGKNYPLEGFPDGNEILFGMLKDWWEAYGGR